MTGWFMRDSLWLVLVLVMASALAWADEASDILGKVSADEVNKAQSVLSQQARSLGCKDYKIKALESVGVMRNPKDKQGHDAWWTARYSAKACGMMEEGNVEFDMRGDALKVSSLARGDSRADATLQADVRQSLAVTVWRAVPTCREGIRVRNAKLIDQPDKNGKWRELWVAIACGRDVGQLVTFIPNNKGIGFTMTMPKQ